MRIGPGNREDREVKGSSKDINMKMIFLLFLIHFTGDFYNSFVSPLLPAFASTFSLTLTQVGFLAAISRVLSFVVQPPVGYLADHYRTRLFILGGPLLSTIFMSLTGVAPNLLVLTFFIALGSMGGAMFHPTAAGMVYSFAGSRFAFSMAFYSFGGTLGYGVGPVFIAYLVARFGLHSSIYAMILGLAIICVIFKHVPLPVHEGLRKFGFIGSLKEVFGGVWKSIILIWVIGVLRTFVGQSFLTFVPVLFSREGYSLVSVGLMVSLYNVAGAISGLFAGFLADRIGYKPVFYLSFCLSAPTLYLLLVVPEGAFVLGFPWRLFCDVDATVICGRRSRNCAPRKIDGLGPDARACLRHGRHDDAHHWKTGRPLLHSQRPQCPPAAVSTDDSNYLSYPCPQKQIKVRRRIPRSPPGTSTH